MLKFQKLVKISKKLDASFEEKLVFIFLIIANEDTLQPDFHPYCIVMTRERNNVKRNMSLNSQSLMGQMGWLSTFFQ